MGLPQSVWVGVALFLLGEDLCRLAVADLRCRAVSEATVQRNLAEWFNWNPRPYAGNFSRWPLMCLVEPGQLRRSSALDLQKEALWHEYWMQALQWWSDVH